MRKVVALVLGILGLFLLGCYSDDEYQFVQLRIQDYLSLPNREFETTGATAFHYPMILEKFSPQSNSYVLVNVANNLLVAERGSVSEQYNSIEAMLNDANDSYESRVGVILVETGNFRFSFDFLTLYPITDGDRISLYIDHSFTTASPEDFEFEVTE